MLWKMEMTNEIQSLRNKLSSFKTDTNAKMDILESKGKERETARKEILLKSMKLALRKLGEDEKNVLSHLKSDAFDMHKRANKLEDELRLMEHDLAVAPEDDRGWRTEVRELEKRITSCNFEKFAENLDLSVVSAPSETLNSVAEKVAEVAQLQMPNYYPTLFSLVTAQAPIAHFDRSSSTSTSTTDSHQSGSDYFEIFIKSMEKSNLPGFLLKMMTISFRCQSGALIEESSVLSKIENKRAIVYPDGKTIKVLMKRPKNLACTVSVKLFNSNIKDSPQLQLFKDESSPEHVSHNITVGAENQTGIEVFDADTSHIALTTNDVGIHRNLKSKDDLDDSDMRSLGLDTNATRMRIQMEMLKNANLRNPPVVGSPHYFPMRRAPGDMNMFNGGMVTGQELALSQPTETSPFRPSMGQISTMRPTAASQLSEALDEVETSELEDISNDKVTNDIDDHELSIMDPKKRSALSIDDAQKSLSSDGSGAVDESQHHDSKFERSVSFAPHHQVVSVLATPQVPAGGGRFVVSDGDTKELDGEAGTRNVRRLSMGSKAMQPKVATAEEHDNSATNATPTPPPSVASVWDTSDCKDDDDGNDGECDKTMPLPDEDEVEKVPGGTCPPPEEALGAWAEACDPAWSNHGYVADVYPSEPSVLNNSVWSEEMSESGAGGNFTRQSLVKKGQFQAPPGDTVHAHDIIYVPSTDQFLVSEPFCDRIGTYNAETMEFEGWLSHPKYSNYSRPSAMLCTKNGYVVIIEKDRIQILDQQLQTFMWRKGSYVGLAEGPNEEIFTLFKHSGNKMWHLHKEAVGQRGFYTRAGVISLSCIGRAAKNFGKYSSPSDLAYCNDKILITDQGLHKIYIINLTTGTQSIVGYYGSGPGHFSSPTSIIADESGNMLVADRDNRRLLCFNPLGQFVKQLECEERLPSSIKSVRIFKDHLYLVHRKYQDDNGGVVKYKLV